MDRPEIPPAVIAAAAVLLREAGIDLDHGKVLLHVGNRRLQKIEVTTTPKYPRRTQNPVGSGSETVHTEQRMSR